MKISRLPKISFIILTYNGEQYLEDCLRSIRLQNYPQHLIEILIIDNGSTDKSVNITKKFGAKIFVRKETDLYRNWAIAIHKVRGDLTYMVDQDIELKDNNFLSRMIKPLIENPEIVGSFTRAYPNKKMSWINRFISYHPFMCDPLYEFLTPSVENSIIRSNRDYSICKFEMGKIPAESRMMYRMTVLRRTPNWREKRLFDHDVLIKTVRVGANLFAYVPKAGFYHYHASGFASLLNKRVRNLNIHYFRYNDTLEYKWIDIKRKKDVVKMILWIIYANLLIPAAIRGFVRSIKYRDCVLLMEPIVTVAITDTVLLHFFKSSIGRKILLRGIKSIFAYNV